MPFIKRGTKGVGQRQAQAQAVEGKQGLAGKPGIAAAPRSKGKASFLKGAY